MISLLVVVLILAVLVALGAPSLCRSREQANRIKCASNLRAIGQSIEQYRKVNHGKLPRTRADASDNPTPVFYTNPAAPDPFAADGPAPNDVTAALYLLLRLDLIDEVFICPSSANERGGQDPLKTSNFKNAESLSYGYQNPYARAESANASPPAKIDAKEQVWAGDLSPGGQDLLTIALDSPRAKVIRANSPNHAGDGQNVLYADNHADWSTTPFAGASRLAVAGPDRPSRDNIYLARGAGTPFPAAIVAAPADALDTILLPVSPSGPATGAASVRSVGGVRDIVWVYAGVAALVGAVTLVVILRRRRKRKSPEPAGPGLEATSAPMA